MGVKTFCYIIDGLSDDEVLSIRAIITERKMIAKAAVLGRTANVARMEIVVTDTATMDQIKRMFETRTGRRFKSSPLKG